MWENQIYLVTNYLLDTVERELTEWVTNQDDYFLQGMELNSGDIEDIINCFCEVLQENKKHFQVMWERLLEQKKEEVK